MSGGLKGRSRRTRSYTSKIFFRGSKYEHHRVMLPALRGYLLVAQFYAVAGKVYGLPKQKALGREIPTE